MRRATRKPLPAATQRSLDRRQQNIDAKRANGTLNVEIQWKVLCCTECGRFKGEHFPLDANGLPLLIDPSAVNPWDFLDFNPATHSFVARFDLTTNAPSVQGAKTVEHLQLDRREALEAGYRKSHKRILAVAEKAAQQGTVNIAGLLDELTEADDHGLLGWYFSGTGQNLKPFPELRTKHTAAWAACVAAFT